MESTLCVSVELVLGGWVTVSSPEAAILDSPIYGSIDLTEDLKSGLLSDRPVFNPFTHCNPGLTSKSSYMVSPSKYCL